MCPVLFTTLKTIKRKKIKLCTKLKQIVFIQLEGNKSCDVPSESAVNTYIRLGKTGSLGPWRRVTVYRRKPSLYQIDPHIALGDNFGIVKACCDAL